MEAPLYNVNVRAIKGRFEVGKDHQQHRKTKPSKYRDEKTLNITRKDTEKLVPKYNESDASIEGREEIYESKISDYQRARSMSVGNNYHQPLLSKNKPPSSIINRNQSFNTSNLNPRRVIPNKKPKVSDEDFASFAEKQKLVESIVMNIKNSSKGESDKSKTKQRQTMTSKLEKDLKNALEKGVRKWNNTRQKEKLSKHNLPYISPPISNNYSPDLTIDENYKNDYQVGVECSETSPLFDRKQSASSDEIENKYLRPRKQGNNHYHSTPKIHISSNVPRERTLDHGIIHQPYINLPSNYNEKSYSKTHEDYKENYFHQDLNSNVLLPTITSGAEKPIRPPRKRGVKKKGRAPLPPKNKFPSSTHTYAEIPDSCTENMEKNGQYLADNDTQMNHSRRNRNSGTDQTKDEIYYSTPCDDHYPQSDNSVENDNSRLDSSPLPNGPAPKKPPRTFAHDIYRSMRQISIEEDDRLPLLSKEITPQDIEALYTKPIKKSAIKNNINYKPIEQNSLMNDHWSKFTKPSIAPKPSDISEKAKKRYSVADPVSSQREDQLDRGPAIKRNSSFRFSLRKMKKFSSPKRDGQVGKRWKQIARNLSLQKEEIDIEEEPLRQQLSKSEEILCSSKRSTGDHDDPIYATPLDPRAKMRGASQSQELHYMCSPLFEVEESKKSSYELNIPRFAPHVQFTNDNEKMAPGRQGFMDGFKKEFRQSCRLIQRKFNKR